MLSSAGGCSLAPHARRLSDDRPSCLENPRPAGAESTLTENVASPFQAEPGQCLVGYATTMMKKTGRAMRLDINHRRSKIVTLSKGTSASALTRNLCPKLQKQKHLIP